MRIAVYAIACNEEAHVPRFLASCRGADLVSVADTGSSDNTVAALQAGGATVHRIAINPWRFDDARNAALALVPGDVDICVSLDLDEVLSPDWRAMIEAAWVPGTTHGEYRYITAHRGDGSPAVEIVGSHIHLRHGYRWRNAIHEMLVPDRITPKIVAIPGLQRDHWPDLRKSRAQYLSLLVAAAAEEPDVPRHIWLLGREYVFLRRWAEGEPILRRFLAMPNAPGPAIKAAAMRRLARCRIECGDFDDAADWLARAIAEHPVRAGFVELADLHRRRGDWAASYTAACRALAEPLGPPGPAQEWGAAGARPHDIASLAAFQLGRHADALRHAEDAVAEEPANERLLRNARALRNGEPPAV